MTDPEPSSRDEAALRRLLREARHDDPVPPDVAARLESTLAALGPHKAGEDGDGVDGLDGLDAPQPVPLRSSPRRRRRAAALLVAAVGVVVVGVGISQSVGPASQSETTAADSAAGQAREDVPDRARSEQSGPRRPDTDAPGALSKRREGAQDRQDAPDGTSYQLRARRLALADDPPTVRAARFSRDAAAVRRQARAAQPPDGDAPRATGGAACRETLVGTGRPVAVRYAGAPAVLVLRPPTRDTQVVDLLGCDGDEVLRSVTLPR